MSIQPIVENSINHVVEKKNDGGTILVSTKTENDNIIVTISDDGDGMDAETIEKTLNGSLYKKDGNSGIGIYNVHKRLMYFFGPEGGLKIESSKGKGTRTLITLPRKNHIKKVEKNV